LQLIGRRRFRAARETYESALVFGRKTLGRARLDPDRAAEVEACAAAI
jgi:hypothetical protein